ncbi:MAG: hypothetical protein HQL91_05190 [Magnetococcales bacterium]|nr:hypothetical protein [Magnetococcales bacterium]
MEALPFLGRFGPLEADDSAIQIAKTVQMKECLLQTCPALTALNDQFERLRHQDGIDGVALFDAYGRFVLSYSPLFSMALIGLESAGLTMETAYEGVLIAGTVLFFAACAYWLLPLIGPLATALTMILLLGLEFPGYGVHKFTPNNLSLAIAFWIWGRTIRTRGACGPSLLLAIVLACAMHSMGKIWMTIALLLHGSYLITHFNQRNLLHGLAGATLLGIWLLLPHLFPHPMLAIPAIQGQTLELTAVWQFNFPVLITTLKNWFHYFRGSPIAILWLILGFFFLTVHNRGNRRAYWILLVLFAGMILTSLLVYFPYSEGGVVFSRVWTPFGILLTATVACGMTALVARLKSITGLLRTRQTTGIRPSDLLLMLALGLVLLLATMDQLANHLHVFARDFHQRIRHFTDRQQHFLDPDQLKVLNREARTFGPPRILYDDVESMAFYFSQGALEHAAFFLPPLGQAPDARRWDGLDRQTTHFVRLNPHLPNHRGFLIGPDDRFGGALQLAIQFTQTRVAPQPLCLRLANLASRPATLSLQREGQDPQPTGSSQQTTLAAHEKKWWCVPETTAWAGEQQLRIRTNAQDKLYLIGVRIGQPTDLTWPWEQPLTIRYPLDSRKEQPRTFRFTSAALWQMTPRRVAIVADAGHTLLLRFLRDEEENAPAP